MEVLRFGRTAVCPRTRFEDGRIPKPTAGPKPPPRRPRPRSPVGPPTLAAVPSGTVAARGSRPVPAGAPCFLMTMWWGKEDRPPPGRSEAHTGDGGWGVPVGGRGVGGTAPQAPLDAVFQASPNRSGAPRGWRLARAIERRRSRDER